MSEERTPLVSIVLPVYKAEQTLERCLNSLKNQTYRQIQVISVIDGSPDRSVDVANRFAAEDSRFLTIVQENQGAGAARNTGIEAAKGEYVVFVDPDDWVDPDQVEFLLKTRRETEADWVVTQELTQYLNAKGQVFRTVPPKVRAERISDRETMYERYIDFLEQGFVRGPTSKLYSMELIQRHALRFPHNYRSQDILFNVDYFFHCESIYISDRTTYHYLIQTGKYGVKLRPDYYLTVGQLYDKITGYLTEYGVKISPEQHRTLCNVMFSMFVGSLEPASRSGEETAAALGDPRVQEIFAGAKPNNKYHKLLLRAAKTGNRSLISAVVWLKQRIKGVLWRIEKISAARSEKKSK